MGGKEKASSSRYLEEARHEGSSLLKAVLRHQELQILPC